MEHAYFENEETLRSEHISDEEARRVVALWAEKQARQQEEAARPTVQAVGEGLGIPAEEVRRLLQELRARDAAALAQQSRAAVQSSGLRRTVVSLLRAAVVVFVLLLGLTLLRFARQQAVIEAPATVATVAPEGSAASSYTRGADGSVVLDNPEGHYEYHPDGRLEITTPEGSYVRGADGSVEIRGPSGSLTRRADGSEERTGTVPSITPPTPPPGVTLPALPQP